MNQSSKEFDQELLSIDHLSRFPCMLPYVGPNYTKSGKKLLIIAESHYLPPKSVINNSANQWYKSSQKDLTKQEIAWVNTREILAGNLQPRGHMIYKEINLRLSEYFDVDQRPLNNLIVMNGFQRPSPVSGDSIKNFTVLEDLKISINVINEVIKITNPDAVIFVSKYAWVDYVLVT